jgi:hypothetical protein
MSADFFSIAVPFDDADASELVPELKAAETEYNGNVFVDATDDLLYLTDQARTVVMSPNFPVFVGFDRFAANRKLLDGHAFRWVAPAELDRFRELLDGIVRAAGGRDAAIERVAREMGSDEPDVAEGLDALTGAIDDAAQAKRGLLLVCIPC